MHAAREAKSLMLPSCAEGLAGDLAWATRGTMIQMGWTAACEPGPLRPARPLDHKPPVAEERALRTPGPQQVPRHAG